jgi:hypothetical protein
MGEATFYLLAEFETKEDAKEAEEFARIVFDELAEFQEEWQIIRDIQDKPTKLRHKMLLKKFPLVAKYISLPEPPDDDLPMNYLAGHCEISKNYCLEADGRYVRLSDTVWHFADWDNIAEFFYRLGAKRVVWESDEYFDFFELLEERLVNTEPTTHKNRFSKEEIRKILLSHKLGRRDNDRS